MIRSRGADYYNPDEATRALALANPHLPFDEVNALAWKIGYDRLHAAITTRSRFAIETTLGGRSITELLMTASTTGVALHLWYVALGSADAHVTRVRARVAAGGHDIPEMTIRARYDSSRMNLIRLLPVATSVRVFDNSAHANSNGVPSPVLLLSMEGGRITATVQPSEVPGWAKPIIVAAMAATRGVR